MEDLVSSHDPPSFDSHMHTSIASIKGMSTGKTPEKVWPKSWQRGEGNLRFAFVALEGDEVHT